MKTGLLLITHGSIGRDMLDTVTEILGNCPLHARALSILADSDPDKLYEKASRLCTELDQGGGVLVLTDLYGSTPSNIATRLLEQHRVVVLAGVNIPMLVRIFNYPSLPLEELSNKASSGARDGVILASGKKAS